jgi:hypothetical protein
MNTSRRNFLLSAAVSVLAMGAHAETAGTAVPTASPSTVRCELAVIGGGSAGFSAALAAARMGVDVVLVEKADCLGGNSVRGGVNIWEPGVGGTGIPSELYQRLRNITNAIGIYSFGRHMQWRDPTRETFRYPGGETVVDTKRRYLDTLQRHIPPDAQRTEAYCREHWHGVVFEPEAMAKTMLTLLEETGHCRILLGTTFVNAKMETGRVRSCRLSNGIILMADYFIDATGDANLCTAIGCETMIGQEAQERFGEPSAPLKTTQRINGVSLLYRVALKERPAIEPLPGGLSSNCWWSATFPVAQVNHYPNGDLNVNMLPTMEGAEFHRLGYQDALAECQRRIRAHWYSWQTRYSEFQRYRMIWVAPALGIRESQRVVGEYVLTEQDVRGGLSAQNHPDIICLADHPPDTHGKHAGGIGDLRQPYGVPYRCLIPKGQRNLLIACRAASFSSIAASSCRLSRTMMQLGQAAGTAAALARELKVDLPDVPPEHLRSALRQQNVQLDYPMPEKLRRFFENAP